MNNSFVVVEIENQHANAKAHEELTTWQVFVTYRGDFTAENRIANLFLEI